MMSVGMPWPEGQGVLPLPMCTGVDEDLRMCSDSDSQLELSELIESITCDDAGPTEGGAVVSGILDCLLDRVEAAVNAPTRESVQLNARQIDDYRSRDNKSNDVDPQADDTKKFHRKRDLDRKRSRRRSTSCSTTSSACSDVSRKHRRKHKHHRRKEEDPSPRVNPIFLWVKQDDTRIVEVLCEDYDKRNRIRLTKTAHGWRAMPRTERLDSALSRSSLDLSPSPPPTTECPSLVSHPQTKEKKKTKRCVSRKNKRCDRKRDKSFKNEDYVNVCKHVDVVNNNNCSLSNNNNNVENRVVTESNISDPTLRSFGYKKACHQSLKLSKKKRDNKLDDVDVYDFVDTPNTESDQAEDDTEPNCEHKIENVQVKNEILPQTRDEDMENGVDSTEYVTECHITSTHQSGSTIISEPEHSEQVTCSNESVGIKESTLGLHEELATVADSSVEIKSVTEPISTDKVESSVDKDEMSEGQINNTLKVAEGMDPSLKLEENSQIPLANLLDSNQTLVTPTNMQDSNEIIKPSEETPICKIEKPHTFSEETCLPTDTTVSKPSQIEEAQEVESSTGEKVDDKKSDAIEGNIQEDDAEDEPLQDIILPEPHLQTPEPSPQPVPEPSSEEPQKSLVEISLQPETSLDSDAIHLPDTTTKSDSSSLISTDISLGQKLSIPKPQAELDSQSSQSTTLDDHLHTETKSITELGQQTRNQLKTAEMIRQEEIERQITADLDEDHLLAIEEILQGEECVEDFSDDDLPEEYSASHDSSPVNLVIDLKSKDQVDNRGIPLSLRTDDFLEMFPTPPPPMKDPNEMISPVPVTLATKKEEVKDEKKIPHAHQQSKTKFLESILSCPKRSHKTAEKPDSSDQQEPLYLGVSRKSASPTVSSSDGRKFSSPELEPKPKRIKVEDITLKTILNRNKESFTKNKVSKINNIEDTQQTADSTTKSRLLELLTNENDEHISKMDPLTQLKEVLSDPELNVPDPLLVPRERLPALVANPAKEIPKLLTMKSENLSYPKLLTDPDLLVVSLSHLQSLLQVAGKEEEMLKYQQQAQYLQQQMKQEQATLDAATATALNQMMWLPYLSQLEAAAMACGNTQDFMTMLNMVFPSGTYPQMTNPYLMPTATSPGINAYDYKSQLEFQQAFALWNEAMMQAATNQFAAQSLSSSNPNNISKFYQNYQDTKYTPKSQTPAVSKHQETKHTAARTSPISQNYQQNKYRSSSQFPYTSMFSIPTSTPTTSLSSSTSQYKTTPSAQSQSYTGKQRSYNYNGYSSLTPKTEPSTVSALNGSELFSRSHPPKQNSSVTTNYNTKAMMNFLSKPKQPDVKNQSHVSKVYPTSTTMIPKETTIKMTSQPVKITSDPPKLKVKQPQHLVDPNSRPKLLNFDEHGEVGSTTGSLTPHVDENHPNLWHPLFSSQQKSHSSPWQWTTPVTVSGE
ncbi:uncharacterized protein LOC128982888 [Macrosteles quadrilineatus]|uniref:uncharacterized protein LOC128982888 n=1 Tax=Macrosteles quadrilineatus TaxID=74068 RepID=UPI0023E2B50C|nr:uncharacterized protein LOC128982888 [Macrosteles quadrilineatus]